MRIGQIQISRRALAGFFGYVVSPAVVAVFIGWFESVRPFEGMFVVTVPLLFACLAAIAVLARGTATSLKIPIMSKELEVSQRVGEHKEESNDSSQGKDEDKDAETIQKDAVQQQWNIILRTAGIVVFFVAYYLTWSWNYHHNIPSIKNLFPEHTLAPTEIAEIHYLRLHMLHLTQNPSLTAELGLSSVSFNEEQVDAVLRDVIGSVLDSTTPGADRAKQIKDAAGSLLGSFYEHYDAPQHARPVEQLEPERSDEQPPMPRQPEASA